MPVKPFQTYYKTYKYGSWMFPVLKLLLPNFVTPLNELAVAMINAAGSGYSKSVLEVKDIKILASQRVLK